MSWLQDDDATWAPRGVTVYKSGLHMAIAFAIELAKLALMAYGAWSLISRWM
jgi:hypothetical protein